ncbi:MAG: ATP-binding protein [Candidatus Riflebacteria bacterium]|nr:ATP-binding protein [Candidatus Riflebacteria bacterium]
MEPIKEGLLPPWSRQLIEQYRGGTLNLFVIHGNIYDLVPLRTPDGTKYVSLKEFLSQALFPDRDGLVYYDQASGISFSSNELAGDFHTVADAVTQASGGKVGMGLPREPGRALPLMERYLRTRLTGKKAKRMAILIEYAQTVIPGGDGGNLSEEEESCLITLLKWSTDPLFLKSDVPILLVAPSLAELNASLVQNPYVGKIELNLPDELERLEFVQSHLTGDTRALTQLKPEILASLTSGLSRINIRHMLEQALRNKRQIDHDFVYASKKELIEKECYGLLEFVKPQHSLDMVSGHDAAKKWLTEDATLIKEGKTASLPMGYLITGPVGTGKTFLITCYMGTIGIPCVKLKNFRSQWQGATEGNMEKILNVLKATGPVGVIIDEADAALGNRDQSGDSGTSSRVFSQIASQMGDTRYRGKILWFLLTCRPDLLPVDLKRQGRAEVHIPLFYPASPEEYRHFFEVMARKVGVKLPDEGPPEVPCGLALSGADIEGIMVRTRRRAEVSGRELPTKDDWAQELSSFLPSVQGPEVELQVMAAVSECTDRRFLPEEYSKLDRLHVLNRLGELKRLLR